MTNRITLDTYLDRLAAKNPVPGGGSAAALIGAVAMSLLSMAARYTRRSPSVNVAGIIKFSDRARRRLRRLMSKDEAAYLRLSKAMRGGAAKDITSLYKACARVPLEICAILEEGLKKCEEFCPYCKPSLASDLLEAAVLSEAGFLSAKLNVEVNLRGIKDAAFKKKIKGILAKQKSAVLKTKSRILKKAGKI